MCIRDRLRLGGGSGSRGRRLCRRGSRRRGGGLLPHLIKLGRVASAGLLGKAHAHKAGHGAGLVLRSIFHRVGLCAAQALSLIHI